MTFVTFVEPTGGAFLSAVSVDSNHGRSGMLSGTQCPYAVMIMELCGNTQLTLVGWA